MARGWRQRHEPFPADLDRVISGSKQAIERRTVALFGGSRDAQVQVGSGVLLSVGELAFLATAAHVADDPRVRIGELGIGQAGAEPPLWLAGAPFVMTKVPDSGDRADDPHDLAVVAISEEQRRRLENGLEFTPLAAVLPTYGQSREDLILVHGFPGERSHTGADGGRQVTRYEDACCATEPRFDANADVARGPNPRRLVVRYRRRAWFSRYPLPGGRAPDPHGMSGGGMWLAAKKDLLRFWSSDAIRLLAIVTDYRRELGCLVGTPAVDAVGIVYITTPAARPVIETTFPGFGAAVMGHPDAVGGSGETPGAG